MPPKYKLINSKTREAVNVGDEIHAPLGNVGFLHAAFPPLHQGAPGMIQVKRDLAENSRGTYPPGDYGLEFVLATDDERRTLMFDHTKLALLKIGRQQALDNEELIFTFDGAPMRVDYAKYLIDYLETRLLP